MQDSWRDFRDLRERGYLQGFGKINQVHYLFPQGSAGGPNIPGRVYPSFAALKPQLQSRDIIILGGVLKEQAVAPAVYDVLVLGAANKGRQATSGGVPTGGGASWLAPASPAATTPLIRVVAQGWRFENIQFAPVAASACITFDRRETTAIPDSSHSLVKGCYFSAGGAGGIGIEGIEVKRLFVEDCDFEGLGTAIKSTAGDGIAQPQFWQIVKNNFLYNTNDVIAALDKSLIYKNIFFGTNPVEGNQRLKLDGGSGRNRVLLNHFSDIAADVTIAKGYKAGTDDVWSNYVAGTAALIVAVPA